MPTEICKKEMCTGCFACMNICPKDAITVGEDEYAKTIPVINRNMCIECGLCVKTCPINQSVDLRYPMKCYAAWAKDVDEREGCSSGGIAAGLSKAVINVGGIVYGAAFNDKLELVHMSAESEENLEKFKGSKYVQSYIGKTYRQIKINLEEGKRVLFIGTPCQVAGLKNYLNNENENCEGLLTVDLICHGTPPMNYLKEYLKVVDRDNKTENLTFRGEKDYCFTLYDKHGEFYCEKSNKDYYFYSFLEDMIHRDNCYICDWARVERCSDITIGDFWGIKKEELRIPYTGKVSVVFINTFQGACAWEQYKDRFYFEEKTVEEAVKENMQLQKPAGYHKDRGVFLERYRKNGFVRAVKTPEIKKAIYINKMEKNIIFRILRKIKK